MAEYVTVARVADLPAESGAVFEVQGREIALFNIGGKFFALDNACPHQGGPLGEGYVSGDTVTCPWHAWTFDLSTGECVTNPGERAETFPVRVQGDEVQVLL